MKEIEINGWTILFFNLSAIGLIISLLLFFKKSNFRLPYLILGLYTLISSYQIFEYDLYWTNLIYKLPQFSNIYTVLDYLTAPLLFLFFRTLFNYGEFKKKDLFHFVPFLIAIACKFPYFTSSAIEKLNYKFESNVAFYFFTVAFPWMAIVQSIVYAIFISKIVKLQSSIGKVKTLAHSLFYLFILLIISKAAYYIFVNFSWFNPLWDYNISMLISVSILLSGWLAIISQNILNGTNISDAALSINTYLKSFDFKYTLIESKPKPIVIQKKSLNEYKISLIKPTLEGNRIEINSNDSEKVDFVKYKNSSLTESAAEELKVLLDKYMEEVKLYRENNITLDGLASKLNTTRHNLSQVINEKYKLNFFDYINMLRIKEAQEVLVDSKKQKLQIIEVAYQVGYNNKATFNNAFKKFTGLTPTVYKTKMKMGEK